MDRKLNGKWTKLHAALKYVFSLFTLLFIWCALPFCLCLCCHISLSISFCLSLSCAPSYHFSQWEGSSESPVNTNEQDLPPEEDLSALVLTLLSSHSSPLSHTVNWIESFEFLRFPEVTFLWSGFGFKDNGVRLFFLHNLRKHSWNLLGPMFFSLQRSCFNVMYKRKRQSSYRWVWKAGGSLKENIWESRGIVK